jgi:hypothetical protein
MQRWLRHQSAAGIEAFSNDNNSLSLVSGIIVNRKKLSESIVRQQSMWSTGCYTNHSGQYDVEEVKVD